MEKKIDKEYMGNLKEKRRISQIADIDRMLAEMSHGQVENVHKYVTDEYIEPDICSHRNKGVNWPYIFRKIIQIRFL